MSDSTISRLGSQSFTPPEPFELPERPVKRARREDKRSGLAEGDFLAPAPVPASVLAPEPEPQPDPIPEPIMRHEAAHAPEPEAEIEIENGIEDAPVAEPALQQKPEPKFSMRKRIAVLLAAIAVPAMATTSGDFVAEPGAAPTVAETYAALTDGEVMPFEEAGMSFPGSAFFYVDDSPEKGLVALPAADPLSFGGEFGRDVGSLIDAGPAASAFFVAGSATSKERALQCLSQAVWYEAGTESEAGQRAVAQVVLNRVAHPNWPSSVCGVVYEGSQRSTGCQFTFTCDGSLRRKTLGASWTRAQEIAADALGGKIYAPIGLATHYHTRWVDPSWASSLDHIGTIGAHRFYRTRGAAGEKSAFTGTYSGIEPNVSGRIPSAPSTRPARASTSTLPTPSRTPRAGTRGGAATRSPITAPSAATDTPAAASSSAATDTPAPAPALRQSGDVKEQYSNAGRWKKRPDKAPAAPPPSDD